jgi:hypothetical protein
VLHPANKHAIRIMNDYGLKRKPLPDSVPGILGAGKFLTRNLHFENFNV